MKKLHFILCLLAASLTAALARETTTNGGNWSSSSSSSASGGGIASTGAGGDDAPPSSSSSSSSVRMSEHEEEEEHQEDSKRKGLRAMAKANGMADLASIVNVDKDIASLSVEERIALSTDLLKSMEEAIEKLSEFDASEIPEFEQWIQTANKVAQDGKNNAQSVIDIMVAAVSDSSSDSKKPDTLAEKGRSSIANGNPVTDESTESDSVPNGNPVTDDGTTKSELARITPVVPIEQRHRRTTKSTAYDQEQGRRRASSSSGSSGSGGGAGSGTGQGFSSGFKKAGRNFGSHSHFHNKAGHFTDAMLSGNTGFVNQHLHALHQQHRATFSSPDSQGEGGRRRLTKAEQCTQLAACAESMTLYDLFIYFHGDDVDPQGGTVDGNVFTFDEGNLKAKHDQIKSLAAAAAANNNNCDDLLKEFHRTIEHGDVPQWEGATVSQVCLAEGSTQYVKLADATTASISVDRTLAMTALKKVFDGNNTAGFQKFWGSKSQIDVAADGSVWALNSGGHIYRFNNDPTKSWWDNMDHGSLLKHVSVGKETEVWGVTFDDYLMKFNFGTNDWDIQNWVRATNVSAAADGTVRIIGIDNKIWKNGPGGAAWGPDDDAPANPKVVSVGSADHMWVITDNDEIYRYTKATDEWKSIDWQNANEKLHTLSVAADGTVWGVSTADAIWRFDSSREGDTGPWVRVTSVPSGGSSWKRIGVGSQSDIWAIADNGDIYRHYPANGFEQAWGNLVNVDAASDGTVWGVADWGAVYYRANPTLSDPWDEMTYGPRNFKQVSVGSATEVWAVTDDNDGNYLKKFDFVNNKWEGHSLVKCKSVSAAADGTVKMIGTNDKVYYRVHGWTFQEDNAATALNPRSISVGSADHMWAIMQDWSLQRYTKDDGWQNVDWQNVHETLHSLSVAADGTVWGIGDGGVWRFDSSLEGQTDPWIRVIRLPLPDGTSKLDHIGVGSRSNIWTVSDGPQLVYRYSPGVADIFLDAADQFDGLRDAFAMEPIDCAESMYNHSDRAAAPAYQLEPFVFGKNGAATNKDANKIRIPVALDTSLGVGASRTKHGKLKGNGDPAFTFVDYSTLLAEYEACVAVSEENATATNVAAMNSANYSVGSEVLEKEIDDFIENLSECIAAFFEPVDLALELVFGANPSPGFICGVKEAVIVKGKSFPGSCCLDAPFELDSADWGHKYECSLQCKNYGPYFAGISLDACEAQGGTWCPAPPDCTELKTCVAKEMTWATLHRRPSYLSYLSSSPNISNSTDAIQCGMAREYFGFVDTFINDDQICDDIEQFRYTRDFDFIDEFYNQGSGSSPSDPPGDDDVSGGGGGGGNPEPGTIPYIVLPPLELTEPDRGRSEAPLVLSGMSSRELNHGSEHKLMAFGAILEQVSAFPCPAGVPDWVENFCLYAQYFITTMMRFLEYCWARVHLINLFQYGEGAETDNIAPIMSEEEIAVVFKNMETTGTWMQQSIRALADGAVDFENSVNGKLHDVKQILDAIKDHHSIIINRDRRLPAIEALPSTTPEAPQQGPDVSVAIADSMSFVCLTTLLGKEVTPATFELSAIDDTANALMYVVDDVSVVNLSEGEVLVKIPPDIRSRVFSLKVALSDDWEEDEVSTTVLVRLPDPPAEEERSWLGGAGMLLAMTCSFLVGLLLRPANK